MKEHLYSLESRLTWKDREGEAGQGRQPGSRQQWLSLLEGEELSH